MHGRVRLQRECDKILCGIKSVTVTNNTTRRSVALTILAVGGLLAVSVALPTHMRATATPLHAQPQSAPPVALALEVAQAAAEHGDRSRIQ